MGKVKDPAHPIRVIGQGLELYLQLCWGKHIVFRDSYQFLEGALAALVDTLRSAEGGVRNFKQLAAGFGYAAEPVPAFERLLRKGVFPYDWFDDWRKLSQTTLPTKEEFYNLLTQSAISDTEYQFAQTMWAEYKCATFRDYLEL